MNCPSCVPRIFAFALGKAVVVAVLFILWVVIFRPPLHFPKWNRSIELPGRTVLLKRGMSVGDVEGLIGKDVTLSQGRRVIHEYFVLDDIRGNSFRVIFLNGKLREIEKID